MRSCIKCCCCRRRSELNNAIPLVHDSEHPQPLRRWCCYKRRVDTDTFVTPAATSVSSFTSANSEDTENELVETVRHCLCDEISRISSTSMREAHASLKRIAEGGRQGSDDVWRDCGTPGVVKCHLRTLRRAPDDPPMIEVLIEAHTADFAAGIPFVETTALGTAVGPIPVAFEFELWQDWVPFVKASEVLHSWSLSENIVRLTAKAPFINLTVIFTLYTCFLDKLETEGYLEFVMCSLRSELGRKADASLAEREGTRSSLANSTTTPAQQTFLGIQIPAAVTSKMRRVEKFERISFRLWPQEKGNGRVQLTLLARDRLPFESITNKVWKMFAQEVFVRIMKQATAIGGQSVSAHRLAMYQDLERKLAGIEARRFGA